MKISPALAIMLFIFNPLIASADETALCAEFTEPFPLVADFDANGTVNGKDIAMLAKYMGKKKNAVYSVIFDRNDDGEIDVIDMFMSTRDMGKPSSLSDQNLVTNYNNYLEDNYDCKEVVIDEVVTDEVVIDDGIDCPYDPDYCQYINW